MSKTREGLLTLNEISKRRLQTDFVNAFLAVQREAHDINEKNGFNAEDHLIDEFEKWLNTNVRSDDYDKFQPLIPAFRNARTGLKIALVTGELSEALEAVRKNLGADDHIPAFTAEEAEIADNVIRLMNYATDRHLRLALAIVHKIEFNRNRQDHSKEGRAAKHGKKF